ncbi:glycosyltransferase family 71 protein [Leptodontidium sp. MPI-SDFR-AT-0119]|nr:glycosyltransferase family 71 protein [Leptodontidium sp. MPI-SDFR-AT-0119]
MSSLFQRPKLLAAAFFVAVIVYFLFLSLHDEFEDYVKVPFISNLSPPTSSLAGLVENVHTLPNADAYLPHFKAVTSLPSISLAEAKAGCTWKDEQGVNFMYGGDADWVIRERNESELSSHRSEWQSFITNNLIPYSRYSSRFSGRGIAVVAGNERTMKRVNVLLRALKRLNSSLPVEIHFYGDEVPASTQTEMLKLFPNLYFNDLSSSTNIIPTGFNYFLANFQFKTAAVLNSRFAEVLLLDSDNIPAIDPESLFESDTYREFGTLFWPDIARTRPNNPIWAITNTICIMDEYEQESGQLLVDKRRFFYHLQLAAWLNNENAAYYNRFLLGDKDMFRFAWHALKTRYGKPAKWLTSVGTLTEGSYCGHTFAQHHPDGRIAFLHGGLLKQIPNEVVRWQREVRGGVYQAYKRASADERHVEVVKCGMRWDRGEYLPEERRNGTLPVWMCMDLYDVPARPIGEVLEGFEEVFEEVGGYWMLDE